MTDPPAENESCASSYQWSPWRLLIAVLIVGGILGPLGIYVYNELSKEQQKDNFGRRVAMDELFDLSNLRVPRDQIRKGIQGPRYKDRIPALTRPDTANVTDVQFMHGGDRVVVVTAGGQTRAYPIRILNYHEVVNDMLGDVPVGVIYCPLCDSVSVVDRRLDGRTYEFGISGLLCYSNVLMYDRTDDALWSQLGLKAVSGPNAGKSLTHLDGWSLERYGDFAKRHPDATVVSTSTGHRRDYGLSPYTGYFTSDRLMFSGFEIDDRMRNKVPVVGVKVGDVAMAFPLDQVRQAPDGTVTETVAGATIRISYDGDTNALRILEAPDHASVVHTFWFSWAKFHPDTAIYSLPGAGG
ncbi:MAG: hypothetical protein CMJ18_02865 [Phycisphaeraceae bacterium]|nr:hypothetical protein [Phycisphaeraceae bacterium]